MAVWALERKRGKTKAYRVLRALLSPSSPPSEYFNLTSLWRWSCFLSRDRDRDRDFWRRLDLSSSVLSSSRRFDLFSFSRSLSLSVDLPFVVCLAAAAAAAAAVTSSPPLGLPLNSSSRCFVSWVMRTRSSIARRQCGGVSDRLRLRPVNRNKPRPFTLRPSASFDWLITNNNKILVNSYSLHFYYKCWLFLQRKTIIFDIGNFTLFI